MSDGLQASQDQGDLKNWEKDDLVPTTDPAKPKNNWLMILKVFGAIGTILVVVGTVIGFLWSLSSDIGEMDGRLTEGLLRTHEDIGELQIGIERNRTEVEKTKETLTEKLHNVDKRLSIIEDKLSSISENSDSSKKAGFTVSH